MSAVETRNLNRESLLLIGELTVEDQGAVQRVKIRNLSSGGMMAEGEFDVQRGTRIAVSLRNIGLVRGTVAWVQGNRMGVAFEHEIDPKLARTPVGTGQSEAPGYARPAIDPAFNDGWNGRLRNI